MSLTAQSTVIIAPLSRDEAWLAGYVSVNLANLGPLTILDMRPSIVLNDRNGPSQHITLLYKTGGAIYQAISFSARPGGTSIDAQVLAWQTANPAATMVRVLDVSTGQTRTLEQAVLIIYTIEQDTQVPAVVKNTGGALADLALGAMSVVNASGTIINGVNVTNVTGVVWPLNAMGYAIHDPISGEWLGVLG